MRVRTQSVIVPTRWNGLGAHVLNGFCTMFKTIDVDVAVDEVSPDPASPPLAVEGEFGGGDPGDALTSLSPGPSATTP